MSIVRYPTQHVLGDGCAEDVPGELAGGPLGVDAGGALEHLHHRLRAAHLQHLTSPKHQIRGYISVWIQHPSYFFISLNSDFSANLIGRKVPTVGTVPS